VEALFQAAQAKKVAEKKAATKQLAILDVKRATGIGIRMAGLRYFCFLYRQRLETLCSFLHD